jgi:hypothetical protein
MNEIRFTPKNIIDLKENEVFVFGSNMNGNHAGGAACTAVEKFGAIDGQAEGIQGRSYAIPTLDYDMEKLPVSSIKDNLSKFILFAKENSDRTFYVTKIGCGIAGFETKQIADIFKKLDFPENVFLPIEFCKIIGFKGFDKDMKCRNFQYSVGELFEEDDAILCSKGLHFCENPFDVFSYYSPNKSKYAQVEAEYVSDKEDGDSKRVAKKLHIKAEIGLSGIIKAGIEFILTKVKWAKENTVTGDYSGASSTGDYSGASSTGYKSGASSTGNCSGASSTGNCSGASSTGYKSGASSTGNKSGASSTGNCSGASSTGDYSGASVTGDRSGASATGYKSGASAAKGSVAMAVGMLSRAKGEIGSFLVLTECKETDGKYFIEDVKTVKVDGEIIKENTWYFLKDSEFFEANEDDYK